MLFKKTFRKLFTLFLSLIMILGSLPLSVFAISISGKYSFLVAVDKENNVPSGYTAIYSATDFYNIRKAGHSPADYLKRYDGRVCMVHFKD